MDREVLNNLIRFKDSLLEMRSEIVGQEKERKYTLLLNRKTGDMRFAKKISTLEHHIARRGTKKEAAEDWKEVYIIVHQKNPKEVAHFEVRDTHNHTLKPGEVDPLAWRVTSETIDVLNYRAKEMKGTQGKRLAEEAVLQDFSEIHLSTQKERIQDLPGWMGSLERIDAEKILEKKPIGTYLLREADDVARSSASQLSQANLVPAHAYVVTVVEEEKITDILILQTNQGWIVYDDNPNLKDYECYTSLKTLLNKLSEEGVVRQPLF